MFERFCRDFPRAQQISLTVNYRSVPQVVAMANAIFPDAPQLTAYQRQDGTVQAVQTLNEYGEAAYILASIEHGIGGSDLLKGGSAAVVHQLRDYAVLYRTHRAAAAIKRRFAESGIPYQVAGEDSPYASPPIQALIALLRYMHDPSDAVRQQLVGQPSLREFTLSQIDALLKELKGTDATVSELADATAKKFNLISEKQQTDFRQLLSVFVQFGKAADGLSACLAYIDNLSEQEFYDPSVQAVTLLTIHAAKGLEFEHVFLCAAEEGILPKLHKDQAQNIEEEQRLFYVAVTRARQQLEILHAKRRGGEPATLSRFVQRVSQELLPRRDDPAMGQQQKQAEKRRQKRAQTSLF